jgi:radical SAM superfamily enzyme
MIFGFPWEERELWLDAAKWLSSKQFDYLKVHQLHVVKNTVLASKFKKNPFALLSAEEYLQIITQFLELLSPKIIVQRLFGEAPPHTLIAPHWGLRNTVLISRLDELLEKKNTWQGKLYKDVFI